MSYPPAAWATYLAASASVLLPLIVLIFALGALARIPNEKPEKKKKPTQADDENPATVG
jgi:hypothetical protein